MYDMYHDKIITMCAMYNIFAKIIYSNLFFCKNRLKSS